MRLFTVTAALILVSSGCQPRSQRGPRATSAPATPSSNGHAEPASQTRTASLGRPAEARPAVPENTANGHAEAARPIPPPKPAPPLDPKAEAKANRLIERGRTLYAKGQYDRAEEVLKEAVTLYPFVAEANLALGKIFLIRGSANRDRAMINSARLMFEMARALDPELREPAVLLELFLAAPPE